MGPNPKNPIPILKAPIFGLRVLGVQSWRYDSMRVARGLGICQDLWNTSEFGECGFEDCCGIEGVRMPGVSGAETLHVGALSRCDTEAVESKHILLGPK